MRYEGVKFRVELVGTQTPCDERIEQLRHWCGEFDSRNLAPAHESGAFGNLSFRAESGCNAFIITASGTRLNYDMPADCFVKVLGCDPEKRLVYASGTAKPSSESMLHWAIYERRADVNAVFHGHCERLIADAAKLGIRQTQTEQPYGTLQLVQSVLEILDQESLIMMKNHGFLSLAPTMEQAGRGALQAAGL